MFLIENEKGSFVDAEKIDCINTNGGKITFTLSGDIENEYSVSADCNDQFLNHLGAIDGNPWRDRW
jgi:hypothetical protein